MTEEGEVWVLDTSALVDFKALISVSDQWITFKELEQLVASGAIAMPRQVVNEASELAHPDLPGAWAPGMRSALQHPLDPDYRFVQHVMSAAGDVVDSTKMKEEADPYVLALALQLLDEGHDPCVVTSDEVDHLPIRIALTTACDRLGIRHSTPREFLESIGVSTKKL